MKITYFFKNKYNHHHNPPFTWEGKGAQSTHTWPMSPFPDGLSYNWRLNAQSWGSSNPSKHWVSQLPGTLSEFHLKSTEWGLHWCAAIEARWDNFGHSAWKWCGQPSHSAMGDLIKHCFRCLPLLVAENWVWGIQHLKQPTAYLSIDRSGLSRPEEHRPCGHLGKRQQQCPLIKRMSQNRGTW